MAVGPVIAVERATMLEHICATRLKVLIDVVLSLRAVCEAEVGPSLLASRSGENSVHRATRPGLDYLR